MTEMPDAFWGQTLEPAPMSGHDFHPQLAIPQWMKCTMQILLIQKPASRLVRTLETQGYIVDTAASIAEADRMARAVEYSLVVLDLAGSGTDGLALVKQWRAEGLDWHVLILASRRSAKLKALDAGADALIMAPYSADELLAQVRALVRRARSDRAHVIQIRDMRVDSTARTVTRSGRYITLTRSEFDLLYFLACHSGEVLSRSAIWEHMYGVGEEMTSNVIDVCIHNLRAKVDAGFDTPLILTCRGAGYMLHGHS